MSNRISLRFYEELNDFLPPEKRKRAFDRAYSQAGSIKDLIESLGVPHTEIDLIMVNGNSVDFSYPVQDGDRISVYPVFETLDISPINHLHLRPLRVTRFVLDTHLGRLAAYLRMLGFDTLYRNDYDDPSLAQISSEQQRILLTCDRQLLMRKQITHGYFVRQRQPHRQLLEVITRLDLCTQLHPFSRCMHCNAQIQPVSKASVIQQLLPNTRKHYEEFWQCPACQKVYWKGSHYQHMKQAIEQLKSECAHGAK